VLAALLACVSRAGCSRTSSAPSTPRPFGLNKGIEYLFMAVLGGVGHVWGADRRRRMTKIMEDQLQVLLPKLIGTSGNYEIIVFGIVLVLVLKYARWAVPGGPSSSARFRPSRSARVRDWADAAPLPSAANPPPGELVLDVQGAQAVRWPGGGQRRQLQIRAGQIVGLIGPNGAGKSTTFNLITGVLPDTAGKVKLPRPAVISGLPSREIARRGMAAPSST
jgi:branched-chain amino acid transport system permease protein